MIQSYGPLKIRAKNMQASSFSSYNIGLPLLCGDQRILIQIFMELSYRASEEENLVSGVEKVHSMNIATDPCVSFR